ncbi:polysaccharide deacetylase family protein [Treponema sp.]|uniref:polysaccharide deacetylase family protein n=1 Tax=Treponema sp. TaxID=166 RepID=UPI00257DFFD1|nr:polysaccharide deacetylase family protein [Treponema sp.]MBE6354370.1 polysaccharide deacetylase family protein [Treponema sp.]
MKKVFFSAAVFISSLLAYGEASFSGLDLNQKDSLLFTVHQKVPGASEYDSLFTVNLGEEKISGAPELLTCFPEKMELLNQNATLQLRNRYGTAWYSFADDSLTWKTESDRIPVEYTKIGAVSPSPDGKWLCYVNQTKNAQGQLVLVEVMSGKTHILVDENPFRYDSVNVKWAPDSKALLYEKNGAVYFITPSSAFKNVNLPEEYRKIGDGYISSVQWTENSSLLYVSGDIIYSIRENELYTRGLYSSFVGNGTIAGRLPQAFNPASDEFFCDEDGRQLVVITGGNFVSYYSVGSAGYDYVTNRGIYPLTGIKGSPLGFKVLWTSERKPVLWIGMLSFSTGRRTAAFYSLYGKNGRMELLLDVPESTAPVVSPDGKHVAFAGNNSAFVYDLTEWKLCGKISGEKILSILWLTNSTVVAGGVETVSLYTMDYKTLASSSQVLFLSSSGSPFWNGTEICSELSSKKTYSWNPEKKSWVQRSSPSDRASPSEKNSRYRVFLGSSQNRNFTNSIYVRSLAGKVITYPVFAQTEVPVKERKTKKVALIFDAMENGEGVARILSVLNEFSMKGTFFFNGEFIRRYPVETKQIVASGSECASIFYSSADLLSSNFIIDEDFIKRGLARNEDEFFQVTGKELSLLWHAPYYSSSDLMKKAAAEAGYTYVEAYSGIRDSVSFEDAAADSKIKYMSSSQLIDAIAENLYDGMIISVSVGKSSGSRKDYLYENIDLLISAILDSGCQIVDVSELVK